MSDKQELLNILAPVHQEHILHFWDQLSSEEKDNLAKQVKSINWSDVIGWTKSAQEPLTAAELSDVKPAAYKSLVPENASDAALYEKAIAKGNELLSSGKVAAFTVAGGQGTRLGYDGPKGTFPVSPIKHKSLFQLFAEGIIRTQKRHNVTIPWYVMTSVINNVQTVDFFKANNYFGLKSEQILFFTQGMLPAFDLVTGKALLAAKDSLALSPNGHGGSFQALRDSGALQDMIDKGIEIMSYWQVDNPLIKQFDPLFIGLHALTGSDMSSKALIKRDAMEKLGHFCIRDGKMFIIEYSDMPMNMLQLKDADGRLSYRAGSPAIHVISRSFIERISSGALQFTPHIAKKKVPFINDDGISIKPESPNAIKLEFFIFDALPLANSPLILEGNRDDEFAPVKNPDGQDSPASAKAALNARAMRWIKQAGLTFPVDADGNPAATVELSHAVYDCAADIAAARAKFADIKPGSAIYVD